MMRFPARPTFLSRRVVIAAAAVVAATATLAVSCTSHATAPKPARRAAAVPSPDVSPTPVAAPKPRPVYPLTGLPVRNPRNAHRPALSVKIDNVDGALPQVGLNAADLVTDILVEGGLTRLMATFQSTDAPLVGPIRSARPVDADLTRELNGGIFAYSGADRREIWPSKQHSTALLVSNDADPRWFWRSSSRPAVHNVMSSTALLYKAGRTLRPSLRPPPQLFSYSRAVPRGRRVHDALIRFSAPTTASWTWTGRRYVRSQNGVADRLAGGARVSTTNVVILSVHWRPTRIIDDAGNADPYVLVTGSGRAWVLRDGRLVAGRWVRPSYRVPVRILDAHGHRIPLRPGRTWMELAPRPYLPTFHAR